MSISTRVRRRGQPVRPASRRDAPDPAQLGLLRSLVALMIVEPGDGQAARTRRARIGHPADIQRGRARRCCSTISCARSGPSSRSGDTRQDRRSGPSPGASPGGWSVGPGKATTPGYSTGRRPWISALARCLDTEGLDAEYPELVPIAALLAHHLIYRRIRVEDGRLKYVVSDETWAALLTRSRRNPWSACFAVSKVRGRGHGDQSATRGLRRGAARGISRTPR